MQTADLAPDVLSIGELAERCGVPQATLRSWELRYGFPVPQRLPGGHRRYSEDDVAAVAEVVRQRSAGMGLEAAIRIVLSSRPAETDSVYAELRRRHPEVAPQVLTKRTLLAISHAIEDETCAAAQRAVMIAAFQRKRFLTASYARWVELARTASAAVVFADLRRPAPVSKRGLIEVALPDDAALNREWLVVCDSAEEAAVLVGSERPGQEHVRDSERLFESLWSVDPVVVRSATAICLRLASTYRPGLKPGRWPVLPPPAPASTDLRQASSLLARVVGYADAIHRTR